jgi:hypothetical protein
MAATSKSAASAAGRKVTTLAVHLSKDTQGKFETPTHAVYPFPCWSTWNSRTNVDIFDTFEQAFCHHFVSIGHLLCRRFHASRQVYVLTDSLIERSFFKGSHLTAILSMKRA